MKPILQPTVFFGSGPVAARSLQLLLKWHPVSAVITKHTPPHHKEKAPVESIAQQQQLPLLYADSKKELDTLDLPVTDYGIVIDYGVIIGSHTISHFPLGIINSHFSVLPEWRGADPITYALLSGQQQTGVSIMRIDEGLDTGPLLATTNVDIAEIDTNQSLTEKLITASDALLKNTLPAYANGTMAVFEQPRAIATYSQKLTKTSGFIEAERTATELARQVRAFSGWPGSRLLYKDIWLTITIAEPAIVHVRKGELASHNKSLYYGCADGSLRIQELQPAGKNKMSAAAFINGYAQKLSLTTIA